MRRKLLFAVPLCCLAVLAAALFQGWGSRPLAELAVPDIRKAEVELFPPGVRFTLTPEEVEELVPLLNELVVYRREDDSWRDYSGQLCLFTLTLADGRQTTVQAYNPFLILDGAAWRTQYEPCEALSHFANTLRD